MNCSRRIYKGNAYEICLPLVDSGVTLVRIYTRGDVIIEKEPEITADSMCIQLTADELAGLADGVIRYEAITDTDAIATNSNFILVTPDWYSGRTLDDIIQDAYDSGSTDGYNTGYQSGYTDGFNHCQQQEHFFHFENITNVDGTITLKHRVVEGEQVNTLFLKYSTDGMSWITSAITDDVTFQVPARGKLYIDGSSNLHWSYPYNTWWFDCDDVKGSTDSGVRYSVGGDISTLIGTSPQNYEFNHLFKNMQALVYADELIIPYDTIPYASLYGMFGNCLNLLTAPELPATTVEYMGYSEMFYHCPSLVTAPALPATNLSTNSYERMFMSCTSLVNAPELPVMTVPDGCYNCMFSGCTSLVNAPELPATSVGFQSYYYMFKDCTSLVNAPSVLPATSFTASQSGEYYSGSSYYRMFMGCTSLINAPRVIMGDELPRQTCYHMFMGCTSLETAPELPATSVGIQCCHAMFSGCTSLVTAPELPATNIDSQCYSAMFAGCTSLEEAPSILPATELYSGCYKFMFAGCTSLVTAPVLPAEELVNSCYLGMFQGCTSLTGVTCLAKEVPEEYDVYTDPAGRWLDEINTSGVLFCDFVLADYWSTHKPSMWMLRPAAPYSQQYLTLEAIEDGYIRLHSMDNNPKGPIHVRKNYGEWEDYDQWTALQFDCVSGDTFEFRAAMDSYWVVNFGSSTAKFNAYGNIWSLVFDDELPEDDNIWYSVDFLFSNLFWGSRLVDASNLWLGGQNTFIPPHGFEYTFASCTYLVAAPELPMMNLGEYAYNCMFYDCSNLEVAPVLPHNNPPLGAYERMFYRCGNLQYIKCDARNTDMTDEWVREVAGYGIFIQAPGVEWSTGWSGIPSGWDSYDYLFESDVKSITAHLEATSVTITIKSVYTWTRTSQPDWARTNKVSGQPGEVTVRIDIESATSPRFGDIVFTDEKGNTIKISVTQAEMPIIWVDDFPDGTSEDWGYAEPYDPEFCQEFYEHESFDAYLDDYLTDKQDNGCNKYKIYGEMNFEGVDYWIYRMVNPDTDEFYKVDEMPVAHGLLPKSTNLEEYRSKSMASDHTAFYPAFAHYLMDDGTEYNNDIIDGGGYVLVDTE